jgi:hypothetical protein
MTRVEAKMPKPITVRRPRGVWVFIALLAPLPWLLGGAALCQAPVARPSGALGPRPAEDKFGIPMLYPTKSGGEQWYLPPNPNEDPRIGGEGPKVQKFSKNGDGSWKIADQIQVRHSVLTSRGYKVQDIATLSQRQLTKKGYMMYPQDWKNVEGYAFYRINRWSDATRNGRAHLEFVFRGGHSTNRTALVGGFVQKCEASSYHFNFYTTGRATFERDNMHNEGYTKNNPQKLDAFTFARGQWIGYKVCLYNVPGDRNPYPEFVKLESYVTEPFDDLAAAKAKRWRKVHDYTDRGGWKVRQFNHCDGKDDHIVSWGGPCAVLRSDNLLDYDLGPASFREIEAPPR